MQTLNHTVLHNATKGMQTLNHTFLHNATKGMQTLNHTFLHIATKGMQTLNHTFLHIATKGMQTLNHTFLHNATMTTRKTWHLPQHTTQGINAAYQLSKSKFKLITKKVKTTSVRKNIRMITYFQHTTRALIQWQGFISAISAVSVSPTSGVNIWAVILGSWWPGCLEIVTVMIAVHWLSAPQTR